MITGSKLRLSMFLGLGGTTTLYSAWGSIPKAGTIIVDSIKDLNGWCFHIIDADGGTNIMYGSFDTGRDHRVYKYASILRPDLVDLQALYEVLNTTPEISITDALLFTKL